MDPLFDAPAMNDASSIIDDAIPPFMKIITPKNGIYELSGTVIALHTEPGFAFSLLTAPSAERFYAFCEEPAAFQDVQVRVSLGYVSSVLRKSYEKETRIIIAGQVMPKEFFPFGRGWTGKYRGLRIHDIVLP